MSGRFVLFSLLLLASAGILCADTLVVGGKNIPLSAPLIWEHDEVLAPLTHALRALGIGVERAEDDITLTTPGGTEIDLTLDDSAATVAGKALTLPLAPREIDGTLYLPAKVLAAPLLLTAIDDEDARTLTLLPRLQVSCRPDDEGVTIRARAAVPLHFTSSTLAAPKRALIDFSDVALGTEERQIPVGEGGVTRLRLRQRSLDPAVVRMVVDLAESAPLQTQTDDDGKLFTIRVPHDTRVKVSAIRLARALAGHTELAIVIDRAAEVKDSYDAEAKTLRLTIPAGRNLLRAKTLATLHNALVSRVMAKEAEGALIITARLKQPVSYQVQLGKTELRVTFDLLPLLGVTVVLDAGHGGYDPGAPGVGKMPEKAIALDVVLRAAALLRAAGATVLLTRCDDTFVELDDRVSFANDHQAHLFVAVHCNSVKEQPAACGTETYYHTPQSQAFAECMHTHLVKGLGFDDRGVHDESFVVDSKTLMPSVLLELGFVSSPDEVAQLCKPTVRQQAAAAILAGIKAYVKEHGVGDEGDEESE